MYSPALEFFAQAGRLDRRQGQRQSPRAGARADAREFLDAFVKDYNNARPSNYGVGSGSGIDQMKRADWLPSIVRTFLRAVRDASRLRLQLARKQSPIAPIPAPDAPHPVTDLSQVAPGSALNPFGKRDQTIARNIASESDISENNVTKYRWARSRSATPAMTSIPASSDYSTRKPRSSRCCRRACWTRYSSRSRTWSVRIRFPILSFPTDLKWVIITATLNSHGVLKELVVDQHSGAAAVDKMVIAACKKGLYIHNPPLTPPTAAVTTPCASRRALKTSPRWMANIGSSKRTSGIAIL